MELDKIQDNLVLLLTSLAGLLVVAEAVVRLTPTKKDDGAIKRLGELIDKLLKAIGAPNNIEKDDKNQVDWLAQLIIVALSVALGGAGASIFYRKKSKSKGDYLELHDAIRDKKNKLDGTSSVDLIMDVANHGRVTGKKNTDPES